MIIACLTLYRISQLSQGREQAPLGSSVHRCPAMKAIDARAETQHGCQETCRRTGETDEDLCRGFACASGRHEPSLPDHP